jgi:hypothetical protein
MVLSEAFNLPPVSASCGVVLSVSILNECSPSGVHLA